MLKEKIKDKKKSEIKKIDKEIQRITSKRIDIEYILNSVKNDDGTTGAIVLFIGTVRNFSNNGKIKDMDYESYIGMAEEKIKNIENLVKKKWNIDKIRIVHRIGKLNVGDNSIAIAISSSHSKDTFKACQFILAKIKAEVPIWKKERLLNGRTKWVKGNSIVERQSK